MDSLLDSAIVLNTYEQVLEEEYIDIVRLISVYAKGTFNLPCTIVISLLLRKLKRAFTIAPSL